MGHASFHFPSGLGPTLTPLFLQSNLGIVTACAVKLLPRPEALRVLYATVSGDRLAAALGVLRQLRGEHALTSVIKLYNARAFQAYSGGTASPDDRSFHVVAALHGSAAWVQHVAPFVVERLGESRCFADVAMLRPDTLPRAPALVQALAQTYPYDEPSVCTTRKRVATWIVCRRRGCCSSSRWCA
jgi:4-cresol dehydrogenase (hydroxylating)